MVVLGYTQNEWYELAIDFDKENNLLAWLFLEHIVWLSSIRYNYM